MGYSGFRQLLCASGHYDTVEFYDSDPSVCQVKDCGARIEWKNYVDTTNGSYCVKPNANGDWVEDVNCLGCQYCSKGRIDGFIPLETVSEPVYEECKCCGHSALVAEPIFKVKVD